MLSVPNFCRPFLIVRFEQPYGNSISQPISASGRNSERQSGTHTRTALRYNCNEALRLVQYKSVFSYTAQIHFMLVNYTALR